MSEAKSSSLLIAGNRRSSPKMKATSMEISARGDIEAAENPVDAIKVFSEKELIKEIEKVAATLTPEHDWSIRMAAMQRIEGLVFGGATEYACFPTLLKQLVGPLNVQLSDRRSSIVKQACHLLNLLSKELLADFESCAEAFIPVLFKLVVITVLVIAESADNCIKTMLRNCRVARVLPRVVDCAKNDRNAVLRARCCDYALLMLEQWADSSEIQRSTDLYEDLIKGCVGDAMSDVRSTARSIYRLFAKTWPNRSRRLFSSFDPVIQRLILEEDGGFHKRYASPSVKDKHCQAKNVLSCSNNPIPHSSASVESTSSFSIPASVDMDKSSNSMNQGSSRILNFPMNQKHVSEHVPERTLESILQSSQQKVNAIETMLRGMELTEHGMISAAPRISNKNPVGGSYRKIHAPVAPSRTCIDPPSSRDPPFPASTPASNQIDGRTSSSTVGYPVAVHKRTASNGSIENITVGNSASLQAPDTLDTGKKPIIGGVSRDGTSGGVTSNSARRIPMERQSQQTLSGECENKGPKRVLKAEASFDRFQDVQHSVPGFQRPLLRTAISARSGSSRIGIDDNQPVCGDVYNYSDGLMSLADALTEGLSTSADWSSRVAAFTYLKKSLQQGARGLQDVTQSFERVMKLFYEHLDDPHHKVAQAALSTLAALVPACKKLFEFYLERILPLVFSRLVDTKEVIRQLGMSALEVVGNTYGIDSLLPALLRSLDEQRSPKAKIAVIEFAITAFAKLALYGEAGGGTGLLKLWLTKLAPLASDKNSKLKEAAINGIIAVYSHFDSTTVLNFILTLSIEEQSVLRRAIKQYTPRIDVDLMTYLQSKSQRSRSRPMGELGDYATQSEDGYPGCSNKSFSTTAKNQSAANYYPNSSSDGDKKWGPLHSDSKNLECQTSTHHSILDCNRQGYHGYDEMLSSEDPLLHGKTKDTRGDQDAFTDWSAVQPQQEKISSYYNSEGPKYQKARSLSLDSLKHSTHDELPFSNISGKPEVSDSEIRYEEKVMAEKAFENASSQNSILCAPNLLPQLLEWVYEKSAEEKQQLLQEIMKLSRAKSSSVWAELFVDRVLVVVWATLDDSDPATRELALIAICEMLDNQKDLLEGNVESLLQKLLHSSTDQVPRVACAADTCLSSALSYFDPYRCLSVIVPLLVSENERTLVTCISSLTKIVKRLPSEQLMAQLPSFLPALFGAFGNQSADVRKTVVFCLVDIYIILGKAFVPYLGSLSSTQLRLVTIYANRISQARVQAPVGSPQ